MVVWDLITGKRDRVVFGTAADALMQQFERALAEGTPAGGLAGSASTGVSRETAATAATASPDAACAALSAATGVSLLRIDAAQLLRDGSSAALPQAISSPASSGDLAALSDAVAIDRAGEVAALALALGLLHQWGLDPRTDAQVGALLAAALPSPGGPSEPRRRPEDPPPSLGGGILLARGAMPGLSGGVTLQLPRPVALPWERPKLDDDTAAAGNDDAPAEAAEAVSAHFWGDLWRHSHEYVRLRLLVVVALACRAMQVSARSSPPPTTGVGRKP